MDNTPNSGNGNQLEATEPTLNTNQPIDTNQPITNQFNNGQTQVEPAPSFPGASQSIQPSVPTTISNTNQNPLNKKPIGLIVGIIITFIVLICGGVFAAFAIIKNQPDNIVLESFSNLTNAKQVAVSGTITFTPKTEYQTLYGPISIKLDTKSSNSNLTSNTKITVNFAKENKTIELDIGEVLLNNGIFYFKANGISKLYEEISNAYSEANSEPYMEQSTSYSYDSTNSQQDCEPLDEKLEDTDTYICVYALVPEQNTSVTINPAIEAIKSIYQEAEDQWFEVSFEDILNSDLVSHTLDQNSKDTIKKYYDCSIDVVDKVIHSNDLSDLYAQNSFVHLEPSDDSFYKLSLEANRLASFVRALPKTKTAKDYAKCLDTEIKEDALSSITAENFTETIEKLPDIFVKFDGFLSHHLTELKAEKDDQYSSTSVNLNFSYPSNQIDISAPENSRPIMDLVQELVKAEMNSIMRKPTSE